MTGMNQDADRFRLAVAEKSYDEVLDATKHQDDKIGRFLTAIAFLFTGSVAFAARTALLDVRVVLDGKIYALAGLFLGAFLLLSILAVLLMVIALGPNLTLPRGQRKKGSEGSRLFFLSIASKTQDQWASLWFPGRVTSQVMVKTYSGEAYNLAFKTEFKYSRTNEARALFTLGLLFLGLAILLFLDSISRSLPSADGAVVPAILTWDLQTRVWVSAATALFAFILAYDYVRLEQEADNYTAVGLRIRRVWPGWIFALCWPIFVVSIELPHAPGTRFWGLVVASACLALVAVGVMLWRTGDRRLKWPIGAYITVAVLWCVSAAAMIQGSSGLQLTVGLLAIVCLETPRLLVASRSHRRRMRNLGDLRKKGIRTEWMAWRHDREEALEATRDESP
jgi:hypothetical protein